MGSNVSSFTISFSIFLLLLLLSVFLLLLLLQQLSFILQNHMPSNGDATLHHACKDTMSVKEIHHLGFLIKSLAIAISESTSACTTSESAPNNTESVIMMLSCEPDQRWMHKKKRGPTSYQCCQKNQVLC
jgi:hypothetical protein